MKKKSEFQKNGLRDSQNWLGRLFLVDSENPSGTLFLNQNVFFYIKKIVFAKNRVNPFN